MRSWGWRWKPTVFAALHCRRRQHGIAAKRERYEELFHLRERTADGETAECCLSLIEEGVFDTRQTQRVRQLLKEAEAQSGAR